MTDETVQYDKLVQHIHNNPKFWALIKRRQRFSIILSAIMLGCYLGLITMLGFAPQVVAKKITPDMVMTWGIPAGLFIILLAIVLTGIYVYQTNTVYDKLNDEIIKEAANEITK